LSIDYAALAPEIVVAAAACGILMLDLVLKGRSRSLNLYLALASVVLAGAELAALVGKTPRSTLAGMFVLDGYALAFKGLFLAVGAIVILLSMPVVRGSRYEGEYAFLLLSSLLGTMLMPSSRDLLMLFIALELVSVPAFVIAGLRKHDPRSNEASLKFFLFGVLSAGLFAYGISFVFGFTGTTSLQGIASHVPSQQYSILLAGVVLIVAAFGFKISAVPFQFWAPDTYEGSPAPLAAFLSVASKGAGFAGLALILAVGFPALAFRWGRIIGLLAALTMTVGNVVALRQRHLIRLLAYSSIAQAGYMLIPLAVLKGPGPDGASANAREVFAALLLYLMVYAAMNLGAFGVAIGVSKEHPTLQISDLAGLGRRAPFWAASMTAFLLSLGGIPPFAGWAAKFFIFLAAVNSGSRMGVVLAAIMVVNSVVSLYYYVGVARTMYLGQARDEAAVGFAPAVAVAVILCLVAVIAVGIYPQGFISVARTAVLALPGGP
jgi:NADH-quinone oxidoreductase subunit N